MYNNSNIDSTIKISNRVVSLIPQWFKPGKWKKQHIIKMDCDEWCNYFPI